MLGLVCSVVVSRFGVRGKGSGVTGYGLRLKVARIMVDGTGLSGWWSGVGG